MSQQLLDIYCSYYSTYEQTFPALCKMYLRRLSLPFTRGFVHVSARNHATIRYGFGPDGVYHWDNICFY